MHTGLHFRSEPFHRVNVYDKEIERSISSGVLRLDGDGGLNMFIHVLCG